MAVSRTDKDRDRRNESCTRVLGIVRKILQRGDMPPLDPDAERRLLERAGFQSLAESSDDRTGQLLETSDLLSADAVQACAQWQAADLALSNDIPYDSDEERLLMEWVVEECGPSAARWIYPQAPLDTLLTGLGLPAVGARRADFLFSPPAGSPLVIEIDGIQHRAATAVDAERDSQLGEASIDVVRIPAAETRAGSGPSLDRLRTRLATATTDEVDPRVLLLLHGPAEATRLFLAILEAVDRGILATGGDWVVDVHDPLGVAKIALGSFLELVASVDCIWAGNLAPQSCTVNTGDAATTWTRVGTVSYRRSAADSRGRADLAIRMESDRSPQEALPSSADVPTIVVRASTLPVRFAFNTREGSGGGSIDHGPNTSEALRRVLQYVFAKADFREGQLEGLSQVLQGRDCVMLLPTGAGKSLVYQMAGLLRPGRTLVIDPIVALIEDQVAGLRAHGIDHVVGISSKATERGGIEAALEQVRRGDALFCFISPERLQQRRFRDALRQLTTAVPINLAVVDEAHCISEWGHDFRTSYLNLGRTLRTLCSASDGTPPPILALTGTASRAVLRDVLIELDVDRADPGAIIKPQSFSRPELAFEVIRAEPGEEHARLIGYLRGLPERFGVVPQDFVSARGHDTHLGIVFCPFVNGAHGVAGVQQEIQANTELSAVGMYAGSAPRNVESEHWEKAKRDDAARFRRGELTTLVATKAFGMGIDIPNIRYTVHFGIPGSIEAFYQEAGRAGRDGQAAICATVFTERSERASLQLLSEDEDSEQIRRAFLDFAGEDQDDILRQLWFHFNTFRGVDHQLADITEALNTLGWNGSGSRRSIPFGDNAHGREQALHRLTMVGVVREYLMDWGSQSFEVFMRDADIEDLDEAFLSYVSRIQPGRVADWRSSLGHTSSNPAERAAHLSKLTLDLLYETIERSRRRALREMRLLVSTNRTDTEIRQRVEDYFREGELSPVLEDLIEQETVSISGWLAAYETLTKADEGELRGTTARLLESYPDHPGLLLGRALAEVMGGTDESEFRFNLERAFELGQDATRLPPQDLEDMARFILDATRQSGTCWAAIAWDIWDQMEGADPMGLANAELDALLNTSIDPAEAVVVLARRLARALRLIKKTTDAVESEGEQE